ncbi:MAG: U32 family peptidase [Sphaerochaeta sp.]
MTELALPAGSLQAALAAFNGGADAVYLGLKSFSARAHATNFTFEELSKLRQLALSQGKKIYVTVNTLIEEDELNDAYKTLNHIAFIGCDGIIVQDLGLVNLIKEHAHSLALHGSTQLAVHTVRGVQELVRLGFERVVLARELTLQEIRRIREACRDVELKVFIHGALCYSFSGLCSASEQLCGRSANRGACAQICRNYFTVEKDPTVPKAISPLPQGVKDGWFFSMSDLKAGAVAKDLKDMGIESLKIEGRMKSPAYTGLAARYYRSVLDGTDEQESLDEALSVVFSRRQSAGWLASYGREKQDFSIRKAPTLGSTSYPGHRGVKAARITLVTSDTVLVSLFTNLSLRDGLMYFIKSKSQPVDTVKFGITTLIDQGGRSITEAYKGETVAVALPPGVPRPKSGEYCYLISRHDQNPALLSEALATSKHPLDMTFTLEDGSMNIKSSYGEATYDVPMSKAKKIQDTEANLTSIFSQSDTSYLGLGAISLINRTSHPLDQLFLPLSALKAIRRDWYELLDRSLAQSLTKNLEREEIPQKIAMQELPPRSRLVAVQKLPYLDLSRLLESEQPLSTQLFLYKDRYYLPLSPVMFLEDQFFADLDQVIAKLEEEGIRDSVVFGLNNIGQIPYFREHQYPCFSDIYLYLANSEAAKLVLSLGLNLVGGYLWFERRETNLEYWPFKPTVVDEQFKPPLFISRSCFRRDSLLLGCEGCPHRGSWYVMGNSQKYHVMVEDCITTVVHA